MKLKELNNKHENNNGISVMYYRFLAPPVLFIINYRFLTVFKHPIIIPLHKKNCEQL